WQPWIPRGALTVIAGDPGCGKSSFTYFLAAQPSLGGQMPFSSGPGPIGNTILTQAEDDPPAVQRMLRANRGDLARVLVYDTRNERSIMLPTNADVLERAIVEHHAGFVVIDPVAHFIEGSVNSSTSVRAALRPLVATA